MGATETTTAVVPPERRESAPPAEADDAALDDRAFRQMLRELGLESRPPPLRVVALSALCLAVAGGSTLLWPDAVRDSGGLVWILALVPVFLLSYHRGWRGAAAAAAVGMGTLAATEVLLGQWLGREMGGAVLGGATAVVVAATLGSGALSQALRRQRRMADRLAYRDPLTGLANCRLLREHSRKLMSLADRRGNRVGILSIELDGLDAAQETYGHEAGEEILREVGDRLEQRTRGADTVGRTDGGDFAVLIAELDGADRCLELGRRLQKAVSVPVRLNGEPVQLDAWVGAAVYPDHAGNFDQLLSDASSARRRARTPGNGRVRLFSPVPDQIGSQDTTFRQDLERALEEETIVPYYQPVVSLEDGRTIGLEALSRWVHPELGLLAAAEFVPVAEREGLVRRLDRTMLRAVLRELAGRPTGGDLRWASVNLSAATLQDATLAQFVVDALDEAGVAGDRLVLEVTEHTAIRNFEQVGETFAELGRHGVRVAVDDFGTGHSSLAYLERMTADVVKLDRMFVERLDRSDRSRQLLEGILALCERLDVDVVAEGVEKEEQYRILAASGCGYAQGRYIGYPAPAGEAPPRTTSG